MKITYFSIPHRFCHPALDAGSTLGIYQKIGDGSFISIQVFSFTIFAHFIKNYYIIGYHFFDN